MKIKTTIFIISLSYLIPKHEEIILKMARISPITEITMPAMTSNHSNTKVYWYKTCWEISQTTLCMLACDSLISLADDQISQ